MLRDDLSLMRTLALLACLALGGAISLSIHIVMLSMGVPFPVSAPPAWARWLNATSSAGALLAFQIVAGPRLRGGGSALRWSVLFATFAATRETLRKAVMDGVVTGEWIFPGLTLLSPLTGAVLVVTLTLMVTRWVSSVPRLAVAAAALGAIFTIAQPGIAALWAPILSHFRYLERPDAYLPPYPLAVQVPAYISFCEPVLGATLLTALIWDRLPGARALKLGLLAVWVASLKGILVSTFLFSFFMKQSPFVGMLSYSQFLLEFLTLGALTAAAWAIVAPVKESQPVAPTLARARSA